MATKEIKITTCDVCASEFGSAGHKNLQVSVIFTTEQTEGRGVAPYLSLQKLDLCNGCMKAVLNGNMLFAHGAMGYNNYYFKRVE